MGTSPGEAMAANWSQDAYAKAWNFATIAHRGQTYGYPGESVWFEYINHVGRVTMEVIWALAVHAPYDGNLAVQCALLHDVLEDTHHTYQDLYREFGQDVASGVLALTKDTRLASKSAQMDDSLQRIRLQPKEVWMVKLADRITNLSPPPQRWKREKRIAYRDEARRIHATLGEGSSVLAERLGQRIVGYGQYIDA